MDFKRAVSVFSIAFIAGFLGAVAGPRGHTNGQALGRDRFPDKVARDVAFEADWERLRRASPREFEKRKAGFLVGAQMYLGEFGYGTLITGKPDERTNQALREYQARNGLPATGDLDPQTIDQLMTDDEALHKPALWLPDFFFHADSWNQGYFSATGSWVQEGESNSSATTTQIQCYREYGLCIEATAYQSSVNLFLHRVDRWDKYEIVTKAEDSPCGRDTMNINRQEKSVRVSSAAAYKDAKNCQQLFGPPRTIVMQLQDGKKIYQTQNEARQVAKRRILRMSEDARRIIGPSTP